LLSSIARPESFEATVAAIGAEVVAHTVRRDHHRHTAEELRAVASEAERADAVLLTTEKDSVKIDGAATPHLVLEIDLEFVERGPTAQELGLT
jgi:tetraacyldisaccharide 4'-kinase